MALKKKAKKAEDKVEAKEEQVQKPISEEGAKRSVVVDNTMIRKPGERLSVWKKRVGLSKEEPQEPRKIK